MDNIYKNIEEYNPIIKRKQLIDFDDTIADMVTNKKLNPIVTELFIRGRKLNIYLDFITKSYFTVPKDIRLNQMLEIITSKQELQQIAFNHLSDIDFKDFLNFTVKSYTLLVINVTVASDNPLRFRKNLSEAI